MKNNDPLYTFMNGANGLLGSPNDRLAERFPVVSTILFCFFYLLVYIVYTIFASDVPEDNQELY